MCARRDRDDPPRGRKVRLDFRRNRAEPARKKGLTRRALEEDPDRDADSVESLDRKGDLTRKRTFIMLSPAELSARGLRSGVVMTVRGLFAEVDSDGARWSCTVRRVLRTLLTQERHPITVGDRVYFSASDDAAEQREGVIEHVAPRQTELKRKVRGRLQTIAANVDQALIVSSVSQPDTKPHLIDRYIVAALAGDITPVICMNKVDLAEDDFVDELLDMYERLGYRAIRASAASGVGIEALRSVLCGRSTVITGQSGVGKSSLLNAIQPDLGLQVGAVMAHTGKGRHTTVTARLLPLSGGGYVVDTPGIRSLDLSAIDRGRFEAFFVEFLPYIPDCKFADCTHRHEGGCAVKSAVEGGYIQPRRYDSYVRMFEDPGELAEE